MQALEQLVQRQGIDGYNASVGIVSALYSGHMHPQPIVPMAPAMPPPIQLPDRHSYGPGAVFPEGDTSLLGRIRLDVTHGPVHLNYETLMPTNNQRTPLLVKHRKIDL